MTGTGFLISAAALDRQVCAMTETQRDILLLLRDNNSICHVERGGQPQAEHHDQTFAGTWRGHPHL